MNMYLPCCWYLARMLLTWSHPLIKKIVGMENQSSELYRYLGARSRAETNEKHIVSQVEFDSVFNQSKTTFSFGSPDILPLFAQSAMPGVVRTWSYEENDIDYTKGGTLFRFCGHSRS